MTKLSTPRVVVTGKTLLSWACLLVVVAPFWLGLLWLLWVI